jgi:hypothetical protein
MRLSGIASAHPCHESNSHQHSRFVRMGLQDGGQPMLQTIRSSHFFDASQQRLVASLAQDSD